MAKICDIREGLQIFEKYMKPDAQLGGAAHDVIFAVPETVPISNADCIRLRALGWALEEGGWQHVA